MKKFIVTGGAGFIGSHLVNRLIDDGHKVLVIDNFSNSEPSKVNSKAHICTADISNVSYKYKIIGQMVDCDGIFHLAALTNLQESIEDPIIYNKYNVDGTLNILNWAKEAGVKRVVNSSSSAVYGDTEGLPIREDDIKKPISPYGLQKLISEEYCRLFSIIYKLETINLRYFNVFGEGQPSNNSYSPVVSVFSKQKKENKPLTIVGDGSQTRDFVYVKDVVSANVLAMRSNKVGSGESVNIGSNHSTSVNQIAETIGGDKIFIENRQEPKNSLSCNKKAKELLNWTPHLKLKTWLENQT